MLYHGAARVQGVYYVQFMTAIIKDDVLDTPLLSDVVNVIKIPARQYLTREYNRGFCLLKAIIESEIDILFATSHRNNSFNEAFDVVRNVGN